MCIFRSIKLHMTAQSGPVVLVIRIGLPKGGSMILVTKISHQTRQKGTHSLYTSYLSPERSALPPLLLFPLDILGRHLLDQNSLVYFFSTTARVSPVFHVVSITLLGFLALTRPSSALLGLVFRLPSLGSGSPHDATVSLGRRAFGL